MFVSSDTATRPPPSTSLAEFAVVAHDAIGSMLGVGFSGLGANEAAEAIVALEQLGRRIQAAQVALLSGIESSGVHSIDGHFSARVMIRHHGRLSGAEASQRHRIARALHELPAVADAWSYGRIGTDQVKRIARTWSNSRIRHLARECDSVFVDAAEALEFSDFDAFCREWEEAVDADGAHKEAERRWDRRSIRLTHDFNGTWGVDGRMTSTDGARLHDLLARLTKAEQLADFEAARELHGEEWREHLPRTFGQIRYDVFTSLVFAGSNGGDTRGGRGSVADTVTNIVIDQRSFEEQMAALCGAPRDSDPAPEIARQIIAGSRFCHTIDGTPVSAAEVVAGAVIGRVRRVIIGSAGVVTDVGRTQRLFTGSSRLAAMLQSTRCYWHGCSIPATHCEIDHLTPWNQDGSTAPSNGAPLCGGHNRLKESGWHTNRASDGEMVIIRPDGTLAPTHLTHWRSPHSIRASADAGPDH